MDTVYINLEHNRIDYSEEMNEPQVKIEETREYIKSIPHNQIKDWVLNKINLLIKKDPMEKLTQEEIKEIIYINAQNAVNEKICTLIDEIKDKIEKGRHKGIDKRKEKIRELAGEENLPFIEEYSGLDLK